MNQNPRVWQMVRWLLQWLNNFFNRPIASSQTRVRQTASEQKVAQPAPELTNADLEALFSQLLEGVHQGRGQQWAIKYIQRMEDRISVERWTDWLFNFGEKLLLSPAPNHQLATRMVQLGELGIGRLGELAYDIGVRLLARDINEWYEDSQEPTFEPTTSQADDSQFDSPGQHLLRNLGELLWNSDESEFETTNPEIYPLEEKSTENVEELVWEYTPTESVPLQETSNQNVEDLAWEYESVNTEVAAPLIIPAAEDMIGELSELLLEEAKTAVSEPLFSSQVGRETVSADGIRDQSVTNIEPDVAQTLDELLVRLDQSNSLVQQLASNLALQTSQAQSITVSQSNTAKAQTLFYQGLQQGKNGDLLGAIAFYDQAIALNANVYEYWFNKALTLFHLQRYPEAIASYDQTLKLKPDHYKAWYNRAGILGELGEFEEAIASFDQAIKIHADYPEAWASRGLVLLKLGQLWEAISSYEQALQLEPQDQETWYYRGIALALGEQYEEAIASYDEALEIQPDFHEVWIDRGVVLFNLKQWPEAIASWDKALANQPDFYLAWYNRGVALDNLGRPEEAIASYRQAIAVKSDFHLAWYNQAIAQVHLEKFAEAIVSYDNALQIKLDYWEAWIGRGTAVSHLANTDTPLNLKTSIAANNPALNQGGYKGKLASYNEGLRYVRPDTHPEGWGRLHLALGNAYYDQGKKYPTSRNYWRRAVFEYKQALLTLTSEDFPQLHLEVLQSLIKTLLGLGETAQAQELQQQGAYSLQKILSEYTRSEESKTQLALKFAGLGQLAVDLAVEYGDLVEAWEIAEHGKNSCLNWLLFGWTQQYAVNYRSVQQLLNPTTAIIYWHISPVALQIFVIKDEAPSPILIFTPIQQAPTSQHEIPLPEATRRLIQFEEWLEDWNQLHQEYNQAEDQQSKNNHSWRVEMEQKLFQLQEILEISTILQEIEGITHLILMPHRDLHRLPLHALFHLSPDQEERPSVESNFSIRYLPSVQIGLSLAKESYWQFANQALLSVEHPSSLGYPPLKFAYVESEIVSQMFDNPQRIQGSQATKDTVENALFHNYNIFHFTGYIINNFLEPKKSELVLAGDDKITLEQICQFTLNSYNLITLSASEIASTNKQIITTEYVNFVSAFLNLGVSQVVSTLWTVESSVSALLMIEFYRRLQANQSATTALAEATTWLKELTAGELTTWYENLLRNLQSEELKIRAYLATHLYTTSKMPPEQKLYNHPYYWAAFIIAGQIKDEV